MELNQLAYFNKEGKERKQTNKNNKQQKPLGTQCDPKYSTASNRGREPLEGQSRDDAAQESVFLT